MSRQEVLDYDEMLRAVGIPCATKWKCATEKITAYDEPTLTYDTAVVDYDGRVIRETDPGLCLNRDVNLNGLWLNDVDEDGTIWILTDMQGWWTTPDPSIPEYERPFWDGSYLTTGRYASRTVTIEGVFVPRSPDDIPKARARLIRAVTLARGLGLLVACEELIWETVPLTTIPGEIGGGEETPDGGGEEVSPLAGTDAVEDECPGSPTNADDFFVGDPVSGETGTMYKRYPGVMAVIQQTSQPLIAVSPNGTSVSFSVQLRCAEAVKQSSVAYYQRAVLGMRYRKYGAVLGLTEAADVNDPGKQKRTYADLNPGTVTYDNLRIADENDTDGIGLTVVGEYVDVRDNFTEIWQAGNYTALPVYEIRGYGGSKVDTSRGKISIVNSTTGARIDIVKDIPENQSLYINTRYRLVSLGSSTTTPPYEMSTSGDGVWTHRSHLSPFTDWPGLVPGINTFTIVGPDSSVSASGVQVIVHWRDTWIG